MGQRKFKFALRLFGEDLLQHNTKRVIQANCERRVPPLGAAFACESVGGGAVNGSEYQSIRVSHRAPSGHRFPIYAATRRESAL